MVIRVLKKLLWLVTNRNFILLLAIVLGLSIRNMGDWVKNLTVPALAIVMVVSLTRISFKSFANAGIVLKSTFYTILFNFVIFGAVMMALARFLIKDNDLWIGFVILATAPPGVAIAPFARITGADEKFSVIGMVGAYIASLLLIPLAGFVFVGKSFIQPLNLLIVFAELIIAPMLISQLLVKLNLEKYISKARGAVVNWGLFVVIFAVVSLNRDIFFRDFRTLAIISLICIITVFGLWVLINFILKKLKIKDEIRKSLVLAATIKNNGFAAATALALFGEKASLPGAILSVVLIIFLVLIGLKPKTMPDDKPGKTV
jgi:bile acid:Na+ symporter, BASS family